MKKVENDGDGTIQGSRVLRGTHNNKNGGSAKTNPEHTISISMDNQNDPSKLSVMMNGDGSTRDTSNIQEQLSNGNIPNFVSSQDGKPSETTGSRRITSVIN